MSSSGAAAAADVAADYKALTAGEMVEATAVPYDVQQANGSHPAIMVDYAHFDVTVRNQLAGASVTGTTDPGVGVDSDLDGGNGTGE